jgi:hypothetical protein
LFCFLGREAACFGVGSLTKQSRGLGVWPPPKGSGVGASFWGSTGVTLTSSHIALPLGRHRQGPGGPRDTDIDGTLVTV